MTVTGRPARRAGTALIIGVLAVTAAVAAVTVTSGGPAGRARAHAGPVTTYYLSLGDSLSRGVHRHHDRWGSVPLPRRIAACRRRPVPAATPWPGLADHDRHRRQRPELLHLPSQPRHAG